MTKQEKEIKKMLLDIKALLSTEDEISVVPLELESGKTITGCFLGKEREFVIVRRDNEISINNK